MRAKVEDLLPEQGADRETVERADSSSGGSAMIDAWRTWLEACW